MHSYLSTAKVFRVAGYAAVLLAVVFVAGCKKKAQVLPDNPVSPEDIKTMIGNLKSKQSIGHIADIRIPAAQRLGTAGPAAKEAIPALEKMAKDKDPEVKRVAEEALAKIKGS